MLHNLCITLVISQNIHTILQEFTINNNRISHQQLWNVIIIAVIVLYFCNHIVLMKLCCIYDSVPASQMGIYSLPVTWNLVWHRLIKLHFIRHHTIQHCLDMFKLNKHQRFKSHYKQLANQHG